MDDTWKALRRSLLSRATSPAALTEFERRKLEHSELASFKRPADLLRYLDEAGADVARKSRICRSLIELAQADGKAGLPVWLIFLGLHPGLSATYGQCVRGYDVEPDEVVSMLWDSLTQVVLGARPERIEKICATIVRSTARVLRGQLSREAVRQRGLVTWREEALADVTAIGDEASCFDVPPGLTPDGKLAFLRGALRHAAGGDADLVFSCAVCGESQRRIAERLGLTHSIVRRRYERAVRRAAAHLRPPRLAHAARGAAEERWGAGRNSRPPEQSPAGRGLAAIA